jgi:hypothetical protein
MSSQTAAASDTIEVECLATPDEQEMMECRAPIVIWVCGRRYGKTLCWRMKGLATAAEFGDCEVWYLSLAYTKSKTENRRFRQGSNKSMPGFVVWKSLQPHPEILLATGTRVRFLSMDRPDNLRGEGVKLVFCDEAAKYDEQDFWEVIQPLTADVDGQIVLASTFYGENWFHAEYMKGNDPEKIDEYKSFIHPTSEGPAFQGEAGKKRLERIKRTVPSTVWDQEYDCIPSAIADAALRGSELILGGRALTAGEPGRVYIIGYDIGGTADHPGFVVGDAESGQIVLSRKMPLRTKEDKQVAELRVLCAAFNGAVAVVDVAGHKGEWAQNLIRTLAPDVYFRSVSMAGTHQEPFVRELAMQIENKQLCIPDTEKELRRQLREYRYEYDEERKKHVYKAPDGDHDDLVAAAALFAWGKRHGYAGAGARYKGAMV